MTQLRFIKILLSSVMAVLCASNVSAASTVRGQVGFNGFPVPGATITATHGEKKVVAITDAGGMYAMNDLADGKWKIEIEMQCFQTIHAEVNVAAQTPAGKWELVLLPLEQLKKIATEAQAHTTVTLVTPKQSKTKETDAGAASLDVSKVAAEAGKNSADGFLVNGSVNNAATSQYSLSQAFGNRRSNSKGIYNGGFSAIIDNSELDARPYSLSGIEVPRSTYDRFTGGVAIGGPLKIPYLLPRGPNFFVGYQWTRNKTEQNMPGLVPTEAERGGDLSALVNALGQPIAIYNPTTGQPYASNVVPVSAQAQALLALYPAANITGSSLYNYQSDRLNGSHQDALESRLDKMVGRRDALWGGFSLTSTRASNTNLFCFTDKTNTLGMNANVNWYHHFNPHLTAILGYRFSRLRTDVNPFFEHRENVSSAAGIEGNDQDAADWGPPSLSFASGIAGLSDGNSEFNRNRTDAFTITASIYHKKHNVTVGGELRKQEYNDLFEQNPRGAFGLTGAATASSTAATGSDLADFLIGVPDTSAIAYGNADKYFREPVYNAYATDDWRILPMLTINAGLRWEYGAPITELYGRLVNLDITQGFVEAGAVLGSDPTGPLTGMHYPSSLVRPDRSGVEPRVGISWRPIPASTIVVRAGYGIYHDTSVYLTPALQLAQQAPLSKSVSEENSVECPLTLANGFGNCAAVTADTFAMDPDFRVGYAQTWQLAVQRDLPAALQLTATYLGVKGTHGVQQILPNTYPIGAMNPCPDCPLGFVYQTSGGNSTRESGQLQLRRRLRSGFTATLLYTYSKSMDDDAQLGGQGQAASGSAAIAQNWRDVQGERALSTFDQRQLFNVQAQYTSGQGVGGGDLMRGWRGKLLKEWTVVSKLNYGSGLPETSVYMAAISGTGISNVLRPSVSGSPLYTSSSGRHLNVAAYTAPTSGEWGNASRDSITGPGQFSLDSSLERTFRPSTRISLEARVDATNLMNHAVFSGWNTTWNSAQFGAPSAANAMRSFQTALRLRF